MIPKRWVLSVMSLFGGMNLASLRLNLSSAIVKMVTDASSRGMLEKGRYNTSDFHTEFSWDANQQGLALGGYFYGYAVSQVFAAWSGRKFGRARVMGLCILTASILTILTPVLVRKNFVVFIAARILIGALSGSYSPLTQGLLGVWSPVDERGKHLSLMSIGYNSAAALVLVISGYLADEYGWEYPFYCTGAAGFIWSVIWILIIYETPRDHPRITSDEIQLIETSIGHEVGVDRHGDVKWIEIFKSTRVWSVVLASCLEHMPIFIFILLPTYLHDVFQLGVEESSSLSGIPHVAKILFCFCLGWLVDRVIAKGYRSSRVRKSVQFTGHLLSAISLITAVQVTKSVTATVACFTVQEMSSTVNVVGISASVMDMAPGFSGLISALCNTASAMMEFVTSQYAGILRQANVTESMHGWRALFLTGAALYMASSVCFIVFGPSEVEQWAKKHNGNPEEAQLLQKCP